MFECTIREQRKNDVLAAFYNAMKAIGYNTSYTYLEEVVNLAASSKAPRFYTTFEKARRYISILERNMPLPLSNSNKIRMYTEIYRRYLSVKSNGRKRHILIEEIISQEAPSFYLDERTFRDIIYKKLNKK